MWMNLGFWPPLSGSSAHPREAVTYRAGCEALAAVLGDAAELGKEDHVLDVGFGCGDQVSCMCSVSSFNTRSAALCASQDIFWVQRYDVRTVAGVNLSRPQVHLARALVRTHGLESRVRLHYGSATQLPLRDALGSEECNKPHAFYSKVLALDSAYHYRTRERFFGEAWRVLAPGGRLALCDMITTREGWHELPNEQSGEVAEAAGQPWWRRWMWRAFVSVLARACHCPAANFAYSLRGYRARLERAGFVNVKIRCVEERVFPGFAQWCVPGNSVSQRTLSRLAGCAHSVRICGRRRVRRGGPSTSARPSSSSCCIATASCTTSSSRRTRDISTTPRMRSEVAAPRTFIIV